MARFIIIGEWQKDIQLTKELIWLNFQRDFVITDTMYLIKKFVSMTKIGHQMLFPKLLLTKKYFCLNEKVAEKIQLHLRQIVK